jgi:ADP-heptose:LPS heptosyltransferase
MRVRVEALGREMPSGASGDTALRIAKLLVRIWRRLLPLGSRRLRLWVFLRHRFAEPSTTEATATQFIRSPSKPEVFDKLPPPGRLAGRSVRILVLKLDHIGDLIVSFKPCLLLRQAWPEAEITLVCGSWNRQLAEALCCFDTIHTCDFFGASFGANASQMGPDGLTAFQELSLGPFDIAIDLRHDDDNRILLAYVDARFRVGFATSVPEVTLDLSLPNLESGMTSGALHAETRLALLIFLTVQTFAPPHWPVAKILLGGRKASRLFEDGPIVGIGIGAGRPIREWGSDRFATLMAAMISRRKCRFVLLGSADDHAEAEMIAANLPSGSCVNLAGAVPLNDLPRKISGLDLYIGNDTGPTHLAALLDIPTINIFSGISDIDVWRAVGKQVVTISSPAPCAPCRLSELRDCKNGHICMAGITVDYVLQEALRLLDSNRHVTHSVHSTERLHAAAY